MNSTSKKETIELPMEVHVKLTAIADAQGKDLKSFIQELLIGMVEQLNQAAVSQDVEIEQVQSGKTADDNLADMMNMLDV